MIAVNNPAGPAPQITVSVEVYGTSRRATAREDDEMVAVVVVAVAAVVDTVERAVVV